LQAIIAKFPKRQRAELAVEWLMDHAPFRLRLIVSWNPETKSFDYLLTNLPPSQYTLNTICLGYKLRWQVELLFKEWKSYANRNYPGRLRAPMSSAFTAFLGKG
jgi:Transposase DDE domain